MAEVVIAVIAVVGGIVAIAVILAWLKGYDEGYEDGYAQQKLNRIWETLSIIDAEPVKHGEWEQVDDNKCKCTNCGTVAFIALYPNGANNNYCPNCGARMDEKHEGKSADACFIDKPENPRYV